MRAALLVGFAAAWPLAGVAQTTPPVTTTPLPPAQQYAPPSYPTVPQTAQPMPVPAPQPPSDAPAPDASVRPNLWLPEGTAMLQGLDKVNAQSATLTVKVGQAGKFGSLTIAVQACVVRPPDQPQDAAAFLTITDSHADAPGFKGWMLKAEPAAAMLEHPVYDVRVTGCAP
jgi:hypothetical protein